MVDVFHRVPWVLGGVARSADPGQGLVRVRGGYVLHGDAGVDAEEADEGDRIRIGGLLGFVQDAVGPVPRTAWRATRPTMRRAGGGGRPAGPGPRPVDRWTAAAAGVLQRAAVARPWG